MENEGNVLNRNTFSWLWKFTEGKRGVYLASIILALSGVVSMLLAYVCLASLIRELIGGESNMHFYIQRGVQIGILWMFRYMFHGFSTQKSHVATFGLIGMGRKMLLKKLNTMPLGAVQMRSSGEYKNIICDRVEQIEMTLAHVTPEFTANIIGAIAMFIYMMTIDWRVGLWQLICIPAGFISFAIMMSSAPKYYPARGADQIMVIDKGRIAEKGTHEELLSREGIYKSFITERNMAAAWKLGRLAV